MSKELKILLAAPRGFCAGVDRAIEIVEKALIVWAIAGVFSVCTVWAGKWGLTLLEQIPGGFAWIIGAALGAILAPVYGIMIVDYYVIKKERIDVNELFSASNDGKYYYNQGWNRNAFIAWIIAGIFSILTVWYPTLSFLGGYAWIIGAALGAALHLAMSKRG